MALTKAHNRMIAGAPANVLDFGAKNDGVTDDTAAIQSAIPLNASLPAGRYALNSSLLFDSESTLTGSGNNYGGTELVPVNDLPVFKRDPAIFAQTRMNLSGFMIEGDNLSTNSAIDIDACFLFSFNNIWLKDCATGIKIENSDSIYFNDVKVMETCRNYAVDIGDAATNIIFSGCNFESSSAAYPNGWIKIDGTSGNVSSASFESCQIERSGIEVNSGSIRWVGGKFGSESTVLLKEYASDCYIDSPSYVVNIQDFGSNTVIKNAYCTSMATPEHKWPVLISSTNNPVFGAASEEWVYLTTVVQANNAAATGVTFDIKDGATVLDTSPSINLFSAGISSGADKRPSYTYLTVVKNPTSTSGPTPAFPLIEKSVCGGKALNTNATFDSGTSTGWGFVDASGSASGSDLLVTPTNSTWGIYQSTSSLCKFGKKYIVVAKWSGNARLTLGASWDGSGGARALTTTGISDLYGDGYNVGMLSFTFTNQAGYISLGNISASTPVTLKWFAIIEA